MILYHGSKIEVKNPDVFHSRTRVDFGKGFYVTPIYNQAVSLCQRYLRLGIKAYITYYVFDESALKECNVKIFDSYSIEWLDFILSCRKDKDKTNYDIVIGGVANDKVFDTVELFFSGMINKEEALKRLKFAKPNMQYCFRNQNIIENYLKFERSVELC